MKKIGKGFLIFIGLLILFAGGIYVYFKYFNKHESEPKTNVQYKPKKHQNAFNNHLDSTINTYLLVKNAFIEADTNKVKQETRQLIVMLQSIDTMELKKDTIPVYLTNLGYIYMITSNANDLLSKTDITEMRYSFKDISDNMRSFLIAVNYEGPKLFIQHCPMAFNDTEEATWISNTSEIMNPYLGKHHPKYQAGMLNCGEVVETIEQN